ncbi:2-deoxy-5-keto-D-gluconate 6-phosphate aldolase domain-containing protein, partial [Dickeya dianthicola]|uniref:2-deoxy-5-keto-D-gluconate 6-phosphate aldolase domain-containing protein n=1 Tax=Dickeya dianthicola TaxID=204039 RepID=UPI0018E05932
MERLLAERDPHCRGVVILGLDAPIETLRQGFNAAAGQPVVKGFAVGRTLFAQPAQQWLRGDIDDRQLIADVKDNYLQLIALWRQRG